MIGAYTVISTLITPTTSTYAISRLLSWHQTTPIFADHSGVTKSEVNASSGMMKQQEVRSIVQQAATAWRIGDADAFANLFTSNGLFIVPGNRWVGPNKIRQVSAEFTATHSVKIEVQQILIEGDRAVVEWFWEDTEKATGRHQKAEDAIAIDLKDGKISRWREYIDNIKEH